MVSLLCLTRKRSLSVIFFFCITVCAVLIIINYNSLNEGIFRLKVDESCDIGYSDIFLGQLCLNYSKKQAFGNLCHSLCNGSFARRGCIKHSPTVVIDGILKSQNVVIKWKKPKWPDEKTTEFLNAILSNQSQGQNEVAWKRVILEHLVNTVGSVVNQISNKEKEAILENLKAPLGVGGMSSASFLSLVENDEYALLGTYPELQHFPKLFGHCGQAYVVEKLVPYSKFFPAIFHKLEWERRAKLALSFIDMVDELERAKGGPLEHCDIQEGNFGVSDDDKIKLIDVDMILTRDKANVFLPQPNCSKDSDCDFFDCISMCDTNKGKCLAKRINSNLQVLCHDIFRSSWPSTGLFGNTPMPARPLLMPILDKCESVQFGYLPYSHQEVQSLIHDMKLVLSKSFKLG